MSPDLDPGDDAAGDAWQRAQAALFAHLGVNDPTDWRSVALRLATRYAPELLTAAGPCEPAVPVRKVGRPEKWTDGRRMLLAMYIEMVQEHSRDGRLRSGLTSNIDACKFIVGSYPETQWMRDALGLAPGTSPATLDNQGRIARRRDKRPASHKNS